MKSILFFRLGIPRNEILESWSVAEVGPKVESRFTGGIIDIRGECFDVSFTS